MPYDKFCSVYPLLCRDQQEGQQLHAQHKPQFAKNVSPREGGIGMGRGPHFHTERPSLFKKGPWTAEEDAALLAHVSMHGDCNWNAVRRFTGIPRCGKSCRLRWINHLRPNLRKGPLLQHEELLIIQQHALLGNRWSRIAAMLPGRTDNEVKNFWNTRKKRFQRAGLPLHPEDDTASSVEDVKGDVCETYSNCSPIGTTTSKEQTHSWNSRSSALNGVMGPSTWSYSAVNIIDSKVREADLMPGFNILDRGIPHGLEHARDTQIIGKASKYNAVSQVKGPFPVGRSPFHNFSDGVMAQPLAYLKGNCTTGSKTLLPYDPYSPGDCSSCFGSPRATCVSSSCGTAGSNSSVSNTRSDLCASFKQDDFLACLKAELPSVQIAEYADSSLALFNPYATSQVVPSSELDRLNFTCATSENKRFGSLIDVLFQTKASSQGQMQADVAENTTVISPINACATPQSVEDLLWIANHNSFSLLGSCSPTLPDVNSIAALQPTDCSLFGLCAGPPLLVESPKGESLDTAALFDQVEGTVMAMERELTSGVRYSDATSEFGYSEVTSDVVDAGMVSSSINAGAWVWSYMPGILQADSACNDPQS